MLQMAKCGNFCVLDTILSTSAPMEITEAILAKAVDLYDMLANGSKWNIQNCGGGGGRIAMNATVCKYWNCGQEGYSVGKCKQHKNEDRIKQNNAKWMAEQKSANQYGSQGGTNGVGGTNGKRSGTDYKHK